MPGLRRLLSFWPDETWSCRERLGMAGILCGWALQGYSAVGHCRDTLRLGMAGTLGGWALQGYLVVGHLSQLPVGRGQHLL